MIKYLNKYGEERPYKDFVELQWNRKYNECGSFVLYMPAKTYTADIKYIQLQGRPETGIVQKTVYEKKTNGDFVTLSGFFIDKLLDGSMMLSDVSNDSHYSDVSHYLRILFALGYKQYNDALKNQMGASAYSYWTTTQVTVGAKCLMQTTVNSTGTYPASPTGFSVSALAPLGKFVRDLLNKDGYSYYCKPVFNPGKAAKEATEPLIGLELVGTKGRDLSSTVYFGAPWSNVSKVDYVFDDSGAKTDYIAVQQIGSESYANAIYVWKDGKWEKAITEKYSLTANSPPDIGLSHPLKVIYTSASNLGDGNEANVRAQMQQAMRLDMLDNYKIEHISADVIQNRFTYLRDYDLGDICSVVIDEIQQMYTARIAEVNEVYSKNMTVVNLVLGTPQKQQYRKVMA